MVLGHSFEPFPSHGSGGSWKTLSLHPFKSVFGGLCIQLTKIIERKEIFIQAGMEIHRFQEAVRIWDLPMILIREAWERRAILGK